MQQKDDEKFLGQACIVLGIILIATALIAPEAEMYDRFLLLILGLFVIYKGFVASQDGVKIDAEWDEVPQKIDRLAKSLGYTGYRASITFDDRLSVDTDRWLFCYIDYQMGIHIFKGSDIIECTSEPETKMKNMAIRRGLMDGMFAGITGVGVIRDIDTLSPEEVGTGRIIVTIKFRDREVVFEHRMYIDDIDVAVKLEENFNRARQMGL